VFSINLTFSAGSIKVHAALRMMVAGQWECLPQNATFVRKVPRLNVLLTNQKYPAISVSNCKPRSSTKVYCNLDSRAFDVVAQRCGQNGSGSSCMTVLGRICQCRSKYFCQHFKSLYCHIHHICQIWHLRFFLFRTKRALKGHRYAYIQTFQTAMTKELCRIPKLRSGTASKTPSNAGSGV
jgi:hypothetical protein